MEGSWKALGGHLQGALFLQGNYLASVTRHLTPSTFLLASGIFAFKCSRAEEIFNLLQDLMQCNSINVMEEPVIVTRNSHPAELELARGPPPSSGKEMPIPRQSPQGTR